MVVRRVAKLPISIFVLCDKHLKIVILHNMKFLSAAVERITS